MSQFVGYKVDGKSTDKNRWIGINQFVGGELLTEKELTKRLQGWPMPEWIKPFKAPRAKVGIIFGCRFTFN